MNILKKASFVSIVYIVLTSLIFLYLNSEAIKNKRISFFFQDTDIKYKVEKSLALDPFTWTVTIPRAFHNKATFSIDTFTNSIYKTLNPVFLFSLSDNAPLYTDPTGIKMLFPIEFPFFLFSLIYSIRNWKQKNDKYLYILISFLASLLLIGLFLPSLYPIKLLPLIIVIRIFISVALIDFLINQKWTKKYFS